MSQASDVDSGRSATPPPELPDMISDGKRMRMVWRPSDGDGDPSPHLVERTMQLVGGHPTWKIYMGKVSLPIVRGGKDEPPHYVYLDDEACNAIYCSKAYSNTDLREFWPWDFNHQGNIKQGRKNRGRPAWLDDSFSVFAQGQLRGMGKWYTFSGAPEVTEYKPLRPMKKTRMEELVAQEYTEEAEGAIDHEDMFDSVEDSQHRVPTSVVPTPQSSTSTKSTPNASLEVPAPGGAKLKPVGILGIPKTPLSNKDGLCLLGPTPSTSGRVRSPFNQDTDSESELVQLPPRTVSKASSVAPPKPELHSKSSVKDRSLGNSKPKRTSAGYNSTGHELLRPRPTESTLLKRRFVTSVECGSPSPKKRMQSSQPTGPHSTSNFGGDGANDDENDGGNGNELIDIRHALDKDKLMQHVQPRSQSLSFEEDVNQLRWDLKATQTHLINVTEERDNYRQVIVMLLAGKLSQQNDMIDRVAAFQTLTDSFDAFKETAMKLADTAKREIEPSVALCDGLGSVLDRAGKYMYFKGLDEEWKTLQEDAQELNEARGVSGSQPTRTWQYA